jgi:hypothetical protein
LTKKQKEKEYAAKMAALVTAHEEEIERLGRVAADISRAGGHLSAASDTDAGTVLSFIDKLGVVNHRAYGENLLAANLEEVEEAGHYGTNQEVIGWDDTSLTICTNLMGSMYSTLEGGMISHEVGDFY